MTDAMYTHDIAMQIVEVFEELLDKKDITIPCDDEDEESERYSDDNSAALYGSEYSEVLDSVEDILVQAFTRMKEKTEIISYEFSGSV